MHPAFAVTEITVEPTASQGDAGISISGRSKGQRRRDAHLKEDQVSGHKCGKYQVSGVKYQD
jgi:hypothetical protein